MVKLTDRYLTWTARHAQGVMMAFSVVLIFALIVAILGWNKAHTVENQLEAEKLGKAIADVTTCFNQAKNRPKLIVILQGIAVEIEPDPRQALNELISDYEMSTPHEKDCVQLATEKGIDPAPYVKHPPAEAGTEEGGNK